MFHLHSQMQTELKPNLRGGVGSPAFCHLFSKEDMGNRASMLAAVTLQPGESVGEHPHVDNCEVYYILSGSKVEDVVVISGSSVQGIVSFPSF